MCCFLHRKISPFYSTNPMCYFQDFFLEFKNLRLQREISLHSFINFSTSTGSCYRIHQSQPSNTVITLNIGTVRHQQIMQILIRWLLLEQSGQGLHCLLFSPHLSDQLLNSKSNPLKFYNKYTICTWCPNLQGFYICCKQNCWMVTQKCVVGVGFCPQKVNPFIPSYLITYNMQCLDSLSLLAEK